MKENMGKRIVVLIDKRVGNANQAVSLAEKLGQPFEIVNVEYNSFAKLPNSLLGLWPIHVKNSVMQQFKKDNLPQLIISSGRRLAALAIYLKRLSGNQCKIIQIMRPSINPEEFDMIILPQHDSFNQILPNIIRVIGALNNVQSRLESEGGKLKLTYPELGSFVAVIVGGSSRKFNFTEENGRELLEQVIKVSENHSLPLFVSFSRRTPENVKKLFKEKLAWPNIIFDPTLEEDNPYPAILGAAKYIITTVDSISMTSEAASTGKPIYAYCPANFKAQKHRFFLQQLIDLGVLKRLETTTTYLQEYDYEPLDEVSKVADIIIDAFFIPNTK